MESKTKKEKNTIFQMVLPVAIFVVFSLSVLMVYSKKMNKIFEDALEEQTESAAVYYSIKIQQELVNLAKASRPVADIISADAGTEEISLKALAENTHGDRVVLLDGNGNGIDTENAPVFWDPGIYKDDLRIGKSTYHYLGAGVIGVMTPVMKDGNMERLLLVEYNTKRLDEQFNNFNFGRETWVALVDNNGRVIYLYSGNAPDYICEDDNFFDKVSVMKNGSVAGFLDDVTKDISGNIELDFEGDHRTLFYKSLGVDNWYLLIGVPESYMQVWIESKYKTVSQMAQWILAGMALFIAMIVFINVMDRIRRKIKSDGLIQLAETDQLTNLFNKVTTEKKIKEFIAQHPETQSLIFILDIDNFKKINDTMGHAFGDEVLRAIGQRIRMEFRASDIIGRAGGDEFIIFLKGLKEEEVILREAAKVENFFKDFKAGEGYVKYSATASIGCAVFPRDADDFEGLYKAADQALYKAKQRGKNQLAFYKDPEGFGQSV